MHLIKRLCGQSGVAWHPVRSASVASFVLLIEKLLGQARGLAARIVLLPSSRLTPDNCNAMAPMLPDR